MEIHQQLLVYMPGMPLTANCDQDAKQFCDAGEIHMAVMLWLASALLGLAAESSQSWLLCVISFGGTCTLAAVEEADLDLLHVSLLSTDDCHFHGMNCQPAINPGMGQMLGARACATEVILSQACLSAAACTAVVQIQLSTAVAAASWFLVGLSGYKCRQAVPSCWSLVAVFDKQQLSRAGLSLARGLHE